MRMRGFTWVGQRREKGEGEGSGLDTNGFLIHEIKAAHHGGGSPIWQSAASSRNTMGLENVNKCP